MLSRNFIAAFVFSLSLHVALMTAVLIVVPEDRAIKKPYTRINFLGSILKKTTFDIMIEDTGVQMSLPAEIGMPEINSKAARTRHMRRSLASERPGIRHPVKEEKKMMDFFIGEKTSQATQRPQKNTPVIEMNNIQEENISKPPAPELSKDEFPGVNVLKVEMRLLVDTNGSVKQAIPLTTSGNNVVDMKALRYVRSWVFPASSELLWREVTVEMKVGKRDDDTT